MKQNNLEKARRSIGMTQEQVASAIGVSRPTYINLEKGKKELTVSQAEMLSAIFHVDIDTLLGKAIGDSVFSDIFQATDKYKQIILNVLHSGANEKGEISKVKLAKLVYLVDFTWYYEHTTPMSSAIYRKFPRGPVADMFFRSIDELEDDGLIVRKQKGQAVMFLLAEESVSKDKLSNDELQLINRIGAAWKNKSTDEIINFTHEQFPWQICHDGELIPYELIFQEEPERIYGPARL